MAGKGRIPKSVTRGVLITWPEDGTPSFEATGLSPREIHRLLLATAMQTDALRIADDDGRIVQAYEQGKHDATAAGAASALEPSAG